LILAALVQNLISKKWSWRPFWIEQPVLLIRFTPAYGSYLDNRVKVISNRICMRCMLSEYYILCINYMYVRT